MNVFLVTLLVETISCFPDDVYSPEYRYIDEGDINIGAILSIHSSNSLMNCTTDIKDVRNVRNVEAVTFAVHEINSREDILPNVTLGFDILDDCYSSSIALARAIQFMPSSSRKTSMCSKSECHNENNHNTLVNPSELIVNHGEDDAIFFDVVGVIGTYTSKLSIVVADVLNLFRMPQISHTATSDILSRKDRFPYFFRMVPPDHYQVKAICSLLKHFDWTHVSIVYSEGGYGHEAVKQLENILLTSNQSSICIEDTVEIAMHCNERDFNQILTQLDKKSDVRVVIAYVEIEDARSLISAVQSSRLLDRFVWIGSDAFSLMLDNHPGLSKFLPGTITIQPHSARIPRFKKHLRKLNNPLYRAKSKNPWVEALVQAQLSNHDSDTKADLLIRSSFVEPYLIDSVYAFAYAIDNVVKKYCQHIENEGKSLFKCVSKVGIYDELRHFKFPGSIGEIKFNKDGDVMTKYDIRQCPDAYNIEGKYEPRTIGYWDMNDERLHITTDNLSWPTDSVPISSCPAPCTTQMGTIYYYTKLTCCWTCVTCNFNEIPTANATRCEACLEFYWPDEETRGTCVPIEPVYLGLDHPVSIALCTVALVGLILSSVVWITLTKYRNEHVIKCTSVELSFMILLGTFLGYGLTISFMTLPNGYKCYINHVGFSLAFTIVYAPLLVKTNSIYRIFNAGKRTTRRPRFISKTAQVIISLVLIIFQIGIVSISTSLHPPEVKLQMPVKTEKFVEQFCRLPQSGLLASLCYNLVLVIICTFYAFKTRKLPDNYKESRYIAYCVDTTLLIWITFLPTYFTISRAGSKVTILAAALLLNATVTILCLFVPRLYSLYKSMNDHCSSHGHHYKDFRIVKHVVTRNRAVEFKICDLAPSDQTTRRISSAVTLTSEVATPLASEIGIQDLNDVIISVAETTQTSLELSDLSAADRVTFQ